MPHIVKGRGPIGRARRPGGPTCPPRPGNAALGTLAPNYYLVDTVVPRTRLSETLRRVAEIARKYDLLVANVFHAGDGNLHPLQEAWIEEQVPQCGFCQNGQIMTAKAMLDRNPNPTDAEIRREMDRTLCRCMTYYRVQAAIKRVAGQAAELPPAAEVAR